MEEVEAKFTIPDRDTLERLRRIVRLGSFLPSEVRVQAVSDAYLDTDTRDLLQHQYACRLRTTGDQHVLTIKSSGEVDAAIHRRLESDLVLPEGGEVLPETWPEDGVWGHARSLIGQRSLRTQFTVDQQRYVRDLHREDRLVAELSIDDVRIAARGREQHFWIAEVELREQGTMDDLRLLAEHLVETWGLQPQSLTKFHLGIALLDRAEPEREEEIGRISSAERSQLEEIVAHAESERVRRRAQLILGWGQHIPIRQLIDDIGASRSWAYGWLKRFQEERMAIFPAQAFPERAQGMEADSTVVPLQETREVVPAWSREVTVTEMAERFHVDVTHAQWVAQHALALYDATKELHRLGASSRHLLETMGLLHEVGLHEDAKRSHLVGRDIILDRSLSSLDDVERRMLAAGVYLHRRKVKDKRLQADVVAALPLDSRRDALVLAAMLRIADGLDDTREQTSSLSSLRTTPTGIYVSVTGPSAGVDVRAARSKADLWDRLFDVPLIFSVAWTETDTSAEHHPEEVDAPPVAQAESAPLQRSPSVLADDPMSEAGRKVVRYHFLRMLKHEPGTREGRDIEDLHDMRVATRRMRAAFRVFSPYYKAGAIRAHVVGLRRAARMLGAVRDLDVLMAKANAYLATLPQEHSQDLDPLLSVWASEREWARDAMLAYLDSPKYQGFKEAFRQFLETAEAGAKRSRSFPPQPDLVRHLVPALIYTRWAGVEAFESALEDPAVVTLHALRIECKRLRYAIEFFEEAMGSGAGDVVAGVVKLQDHLGDLNDADVANTMLSEFLFGGHGTEPPRRVIAPGVVSYLAAKQRELQLLIATFPEAWARFRRPEVKRWLAEAIAAL